MRLTPLRLKTSYWSDIEEEINSIFWRIFYGPITDVLAKNSLQFMNSINVLVEAVRSGRIYYEAGEFVGQFNSKISREILSLGGKFNKRTKRWMLPGSQLPPVVSMAIAEASFQQKYANEALIKTLDDMPARADKIINDSKIVEEYSKTITHINDDFVKTLKSLVIAPKLTEATKRRISEEWGTNLKLYIKKWTDENILSLRQEIQENAFTGGRAAGLTKLIEKNYNVSKEKARFLARQETSLLLSKFKKGRYKDVGVVRYTWSGSLDERERHDHRVLEGQVYYYDDPPITNRKTGARNNPGEDFGCRCDDIPFLELE